MKKNSHNPRHNARRCAMQAIYQWQLNPIEVGELLVRYLSDHALAHIDRRYFTGLVRSTLSDLDTIDEILEPHLDRDIAEIDPVELAIMRMAVCELKTHPEVPYRVVINEALIIAKHYGAQHGHKYINGVLDALIPELRPHD